MVEEKKCLTISKPTRKSLVFGGKGCYWDGRTGGRYIRLCYPCFREWEFLRDLGEDVVKAAKEGKTISPEQVFKKKELYDDFNRRWENTQEFLKKMGVIR